MVEFSSLKLFYPFWLFSLEIKPELTIKRQWLLIPTLIIRVL